MSVLGWLRLQWKRLNWIMWEGVAVFVGSPQSNPYGEFVRERSGFWRDDAFPHGRPGSEA